MRENLEYINRLALHSIKSCAMIAVLIGYAPFVGLLIWSEVIK